MQERFKQLLESKRLTATQFASLIKVNASAMSHILNGRSKPSFDVLAKVGQAFPDVNLNFLISGKGDLYYNMGLSNGQHIEQKTSGLKDLFSDTLPANDALPKENQQSVPVLQTEQKTEQQMMGIPTIPAKKLKRIILFFEDGSFEDYIK